MQGMGSMRRPTLLHHGTERLEHLCAGLGFDEQDRGRMVALFTRMAASWGDLPLGSKPRWPSDITDDHSPFELSVAIDGGAPELRFLCEVRGPAHTIDAQWRAAWALNEELQRDLGVDLDRANAIKDLFAPTLACPRFGAWHAVCFRPGQRPEVKLYLNPLARGRASALGLVREAMTRLGFPDACAHLPPSTPDDLLVYFALDLSADEHARAKVYTAHFNAAPDHVEEALRPAAGHMPGQITDFCTLMGNSYGPFEARPVQTCLAFTSGSDSPTSGTVYFPVRAYADSDLEVRERVLGYIHAEGAPIYRAALEGFANRPLENGVGMQTYVSLRQAPGGRRLTVYLSPEVYAVQRSARVSRVSGVIPRGTRERLPEAAGERLPNVTWERLPRVVRRASGE